MGLEEGKEKWMELYRLVMWVICIKEKVSRLVVEVACKIPDVDFHINWGNRK